MKEDDKKRLFNSDFFKLESSHFFLLSQLYPDERGKKAVQALSDLANIDGVNHPQSHVFMADELISMGKTLGFLRDENLIKNARKIFDDKWEKALIWRRYVLAWAGHHCSNLGDGSFTEFGCYDGIASMFVNEYNDLSKKNVPFYLYDCFEPPPNSAKFPKHSKDLFFEVKELFKTKDNVKIVKGILPDTLDICPEKISWAHIDLNDVRAEIAVLEIIFDKIIPGGIIILDDYGWVGYWDQYVAEKSFFLDRGYHVLEIPTGQGILIKR